MGTKQNYFPLIDKNVYVKNVYHNVVGQLLTGRNMQHRLVAFNQLLEVFISSRTIHFVKAKIMRSKCFSILFNSLRISVEQKYAG